MRVAPDAKPVAKSGTAPQYLVRVTPHTWVVEGASGTVFPLGGLGFIVRPGEVVDLEV